MDKLPEIFGFKAEVPLADGIGGEGVEPFDPASSSGCGAASGVSAEADTSGAMSPNRSSMMSCALAALPMLGCGAGACPFPRMSRFST